MKKFGGIVSILLGGFFAIRAMMAFLEGLHLLSVKDKDLTGVGFLASYIIPIVIVATISFLLIRYGIRLLKKKGQNGAAPTN